MDKINVNKKSDIIYFSHGGGPLPVLNDPTHKAMNEFMLNLPESIDVPENIIVFSAHWEEEVITVQSGENPDIMYDYYGFPKEAYEIKYPCKGNPQLAFEIAELLGESNIPCRLDDKRPYDHGSYIPLKMMYPDADIPVIQISLNKNLDPLTHLETGRALRSLLNENILVIGSGFSFHNMRKFDFGGQNTEDILNDEFQDSLIAICTEIKDESKKWKLIAEWDKLPGAGYCHPREEHLVPLFVCAGLAGDPGIKIFDDYILGKRATAFLW